MATARPVVGSIVKKNGAWHWRRYENGKQVSERLAPVSDEFRAKKDVVPLANKKAAELGTPHAPRSGRMKVTEFVSSHYLPWLEKEKRPATVDGYKKIWTGHLEKHFGNTRLDEYQAHDASEFLTKLAKGGMGRNSVAHVRSVMSAIFRHAAATGRVSANPIRDAITLTTPKAPKQTGAYTPTEILEVIHALRFHPQAQLAMSLGFFLGLRTAEISGLMWSDISGDWNTIHIQRSVYRGRTFDCKTATSKAVLPLIEPLRSALRAFKAQQPVTDSFILLSQLGTPLNIHALAKRIIRPVLKNSNLEWKGFYAGRRGLATILANQQPLAAQGMLRHASLNTTQEFYVKAIPTVTIEAMKQLEANVRDSKGQSLATS